MNVYLTNTTKKHNSTYIPAAGRQVPCMLKEGSSVINPTLIFERANVGHQYNYVYIPDFGRRYFVDDIVYDGARIYYDCSVDVLASYKSTIGASSAYVLRASHTYNEYVIDQYYPTTTRIRQYSDYIIPGHISPWFDYNGSRGRWIIGVVNIDGVSYYCFDHTNYKRFLKYVVSDAFMTAMGVDLNISPQLRVAVDPMQYITCCIWLPFNTVTTGDTPSERFPLGDVKIAKITAPSTIQAGDVTAGTAGYTIYNEDLDVMPHPQSNDRGEFLNSPGFSECRIVFPPFGAFDLNPLELMKFDRVHLLVQADCTTGIGKLVVYGENDNTSPNPPDMFTLINAEAQIGVPIPVTQILTPGVSPVQLGLQAAGAIVSAATGRIDKAIAGGASAIDSYYAGKIPKSSVVGSRGSLAAIHGYAEIEYVWKYVTAADNEDHGRPLCEVYQLSSLPGFQMIQEPHIHTTGTSAEDDQINSYLSAGYFYE